MAQPHPGIDSLTKYLRGNFPWKEEWDATSVLNKKFTYKEVKEALVRLKKTDPELHNLLGWRWQTKRTRNEIANHVYMDPSTLKRKWDTAMNIVVNYLNNDEATAELDPLDLRYK